MALDTVDYWIDSSAKGKTNLAPENIPWVALRTLLGQTIYGGRIDNQFDMRLLDSFLQDLFTEKCFKYRISSCFSVKWKCIIDYS